MKVGSNIEAAGTEEHHLNLFLLLVLALTSKQLAVDGKRIATCCMNI